MTTHDDLSTALARDAASRRPDRRPVAPGVDREDVRQDAYERTLRARPVFETENQRKAYVARAERSACDSDIKHDMVRKPLAGGGWYEDPDVPGRMRFWTGAAWTTCVRRGTVDNSAPVGPAALKRLPRTSERRAESELFGGSVIDPAEAVARQTLIRLVSAAVDSLPEAHRTYYRLRFVEDLDMAEVAAVLGKSEGSLRHVHRSFKAAVRVALAGVVDPEDLR